MKKLTIYTDGGSRGNPGIAGIGVHVCDEDEKVVFEASKYLGKATNNEAEYQGFLISLEWLLNFLKEPENKVESVTWKLDSNLVVQQLNRNWKVKEPRMMEYAQQAWQGLASLSLPYSITHVRREFNKRADFLANKAMDLV